MGIRVTIQRDRMDRDAYHLYKANERHQYWITVSIDDLVCMVYDADTCKKIGRMAYDDSLEAYIAIGKELTD